MASSSSHRITLPTQDEFVWKLEGIFHACASWQTVAEGIDFDDQDQVAALKRLRPDFDRLLRGWIDIQKLGDEKNLWPTLNSAFQNGFIAATGPDKVLTTRFLALLAVKPATDASARIEQFHAWGCSAAELFWHRLKSRKGLRFPPRPMIEIIPNGTNPMTFHPGPTRMKAGTIHLHVPFDSPGQGRNAGPTVFDWYLSIPFYFMHEYVSHIFPIDLETEYFQDGWLFSLAGCFLANVVLMSPGLLCIPKMHATVYRNLQMIRWLEPDLFNAARLAEELFGRLSLESGTSLLLDFCGELAVIPHGTIYENDQANRAVALMLHHHDHEIGKDIFFKNPHTCLRNILQNSR